MSAVLTIIGSSARAAAQSAARSGFVVHAADLFGDIDLRAVANNRTVSDYPAQLLDTLRGDQPGSWLYTGALENHADLIERGQRARPLLGNPADVVRRVRNPLLVASALRQAGLAAPEVRLHPAGLPRDGAWLAKPCRSAGGARIVPLDDDWLPPAAMTDDTYYQRRIEGTSVAAVFLATTREVALLGVTEQLCGAAWGGDSPFRYCGSIGPLQLEAPVVAQFRQIGSVLHATFGLQGLFGVDAILSDDTVWPVEVNPRYTASLEIIERTTGFEAIAAHVMACDTGVLTAPSRALRQSGKLIVWAQDRSTFPANDRLPAELLVGGPYPSLADTPAAGAEIAAGWPIATVLADADGLAYADGLSTVAGRLTRLAVALRAACTTTGA